MQRSRILFSRTVSLISIPCNLGQPFLGPDQSPKLLKEHGLLNVLADSGWRVKQIPDIIPPPIQVNAEMDALMISRNAKNCLQIGATCEIVQKKVYEESKTDNFILILGGDHVIPIGTFGGLLKARPNTGVVWVDAHADINTPQTSNSGNMHGMPLGFQLGLVDKVQTYPGLNWFEPCLQPKDIVYIGLRDLDKGEKEAIRRLGIRAYTMYDIDKKGIGKVMEETLDYLASYDRIHLSYDIDALDPFYAPHTGTAVRGGLTFREGNYICEELYLSGKMTSMELVEVNPSLHQDMDAKLTIEMALTLIGSTMGQRIL